MNFQNNRTYEDDYTSRAHQRRIGDVNQLPVKDAQRSPTDVCCAILGVLFGVIMFIVALIVHNSDHLSKVNYPSDRNGVVCALTPDANDITYPFVFFNDINDPFTSRYCVSQCPQPGIPLACYDAICPLVYYSNYPSSNALGDYCLPTDNQQKNQLLFNANLIDRWNSQKAIDYLLWAVGISIALGLMVLLLACFLPKFIIWIVTVLAIVLLIIAAIVFLFNSTTTLARGSGWAIFAGILAIFFVVVLALYLVLHREKIFISGEFLRINSKFLRKNFLLLIYIPVYIGLTFLFGLLTVYQYLAFNSVSTPTLSPTSIFYTLPIEGFATFLLVIQTIWGLSFFRDSFNYVISSTAAQRFLRTKQGEVGCFQYQQKCIKFNFGSIVGGSLINGFFYLPSLIISLICPRVNFFICNLFDLVRTDAYSYIGLTGNSYCPSVRQSQYLCYRSNVCRQNQSTNSVYSLAARIFVALSSILIVYWIAMDNLVQGRIPPLLLVGVFAIALYISCYFVDISNNVCQGFLTAFLAQLDIDQTYAKMNTKNSYMRQLSDQIEKHQPNQKIHAYQGN